MARIKKSIEFISPREYEVNIDGRELVIGPLRVHQLGEVAEAVDLLFADLAKAPPLVITGLQAGVEATQSQKTVVSAWLLDLLKRRHEVLVQLIESATDHVLGDVGDWLPDRAAAVLMLVIEVNIDFFSRAWRLMLEVAAGLDLPAAEPQGPSGRSIGPTPSEISSAPDTGTATS